MPDQQPYVTQAARPLRVANVTRTLASLNAGLDLRYHSARARALYLGSSLYRIHGTNEPHTIGQAVSSGCIRMLNEDVVDLYNRVRVGTPVIVI